MTQDDVIEMAQECNLIGMRPHLDGIYSEALVAFANLVAAKATEEANARANASWTLMCKKMVAIEREACANLCEANVWSEDVAWWRETTKSEVAVEAGLQCAAAIRARGQA